MVKKITSYNQLKDGMKVKGKFGLWCDPFPKYSFSEGIIFHDKREKKYYILQDIRFGDTPTDDNWQKKGYNHSWVIPNDLGNVELEVIEEEKEGSLFDQLEVGDVIESVYGKRKVLEKLSNTVLLSEDFRFGIADLWYTVGELKGHGYVKSEDQPKTVEVNGKHYRLKDIEQLEEVGVE